MSLYIKFDGIDGESKDKDHKDWMDVLNVSWGGSRIVGNAGGAMGSAQRGHSNVELGEFNFSTEMSMSSPPLALRLCNGTVIPWAKVNICRSGGDTSRGKEPYSIWEFKDVLVTSYSTSTSRDQVPMENFSFSFLHVKHEFKKTDQKTGGLAKGGEFTWDVPVGEM